MRSLKTTSRRLERRSITDPSTILLRLEKPYLALCNSILDLVHLDFAEPLDLEKIPSRSRMYTCNCIVAIGFQLRDVDCTDTVGLYGIDIDDEAVLLCRVVNSA